MSTEEDLRNKIKKIDEKRSRAQLLDRMAEWPWGAPSTVKVDARRGILRWFGSVSAGPTTEVELTREERSELRDWLIAKSVRLNAEADEVSASLEGKNR